MALYSKRPAGSGNNKPHRVLVSYNQQTVYGRETVHKTLPTIYPNAKTAMAACADIIVEGDYLSAQPVDAR